MDGVGHQGEESPVAGLDGDVLMACIDGQSGWSQPMQVAPSHAVPATWCSHSGWEGPRARL